VLAGK